MAAVGPRFPDAIHDLKDRGARLVTITSVRAASEAVLTYYFDLDGDLQMLTAKTVEGSIASLFSLFPGADVVEREISQVFGVKFVGNPHLGVKP